MRFPTGVDGIRRFMTSEDGKEYPYLVIPFIDSQGNSNNMLIIEDFPASMPDIEFSTVVITGGVNLAITGLEDAHHNNPDKLFGQVLSNGQPVEYYYRDPASNQLVPAVVPGECPFRVFLKRASIYLNQSSSPFETKVQTLKAILPAPCSPTLVPLIDVAHGMNFPEKFTILTSKGKRIFVLCVKELDAEGTQFNYR